MTIDEAIKQLNLEARDRLGYCDYARFRAIQLGIEALKVIKRSRRVGSVIISPLLLGETEG